ncbi:carboxymuconolactone decarboxylase family protein [Faunimonas sp. B44]|uniref:carboxymuconolactone decarboxylase family protein n=1 Tax=Faunimonas sp. B44 TaxID=3461493 RepID=UPI004044133E
MPRIPAVDPDRLTAAQQAVHDRIAGGERGAVRGPFQVLLHSPEAADVVQEAGRYLRFHSVLPERVRELAITVVARHWHADYEWAAHAPKAEQAGVPRPVIDAIATGAAPDLDESNDRIAYDYVSAVLRSSGFDPVPEAVLAAAREAFGIDGLVDLTVLTGYYSMLAMVLNTFEVRPAGDGVPWRGGA